MKVLDRIGLTIFSVLILILSIVLCLLISGVLTPDTVNTFIKTALQTPVAVNSILVIAIVCIILSIRCIFFSTDKDKINGIRDGISLKNTDGELVISKGTLEELVNNIVRGFDSAEDARSKIVLDEDGNLKVYVLMSVKEDAVIKELSNNLQTKIKSTIKKTSDLEVKEVNISVKDLKAEDKKDIEN